MYFKGHFNFMYISEDDVNLTLNKENLFTYSKKTCNGDKNYKGKWKIIKDTLVLKITDINTLEKQENIIKYIKYNNAVFYKINNVTRVADNKKMKDLTLLSLK